MYVTMTRTRYMDGQSVFTVKATLVFGKRIESERIDNNRDGL